MTAITDYFDRNYPLKKYLNDHVAGPETLAPLYVEAPGGTRYQLVVSDEGELTAEALEEE